MAQPALTIRQSRDEELYKTNPDQSAGIGRDCLGERLYFPLETTAMRSPFRDAVLNDIFPDGSDDIRWPFGVGGSFSLEHTR